MDSKSLERFNHILTKPISGLTQDEISFLRARSGALNAMQMDFYKEIIKVQVESVEEVATSDEKPKRTVKKKVETN